MRYRWAVAMVLAAFAVIVFAVVGNVAYTKSVRDQQVATCEAGNESRKLQTQLWDYVLSIPPSRPRTAEQEQRVEDFKAFMRKTFAQRDCSKI